MNWRGGGGIGFGSGLSPVIRNLIMINVGLFAFESLFKINLAHVFGLSPYRFWHGFLWQPFTYMFLHGGFMHVFWNMFLLWMFGAQLESIWGPRRFLTYYLICGVGAGLLNAVVTPGSPIPIVGASGSIYGLLLAFGLTFPNRVILLWFVLPIKAKYLVIIMGALELFFALSQPSSPIAHFAHLGGMLFGLVYLRKDNWIRSALRWQSNRVSRKNLEVVWNRSHEMEKLQKEVDELLDKINESGYESLNRQEINRLKEASKKLKEWEKQA
ncbi:MAG: rhomboid family intramembrane serine protease [Candidatus Electryonea clarkiae]|nr:rhomboid family intramembrane serine protease [Candidatus Electryonea clarkiae]MDP8289029.1 rhomboid family intramembrane serine protease [Candidatus Electryonea clarkiae]